LGDPYPPRAWKGDSIPAAACIISAIEDALTMLGVKFAEHPLSPETTLAVIRKRSGLP